MRLVLGMSQMFGAVAGLMLLLMTGLSLATLITVGATTVLTLTSRILYRRRR